MNELRLITEGNVPNQNYIIESAAINNSDLLILIKDSEKDEILDDFIKGKTAYKIVINTDIAEIRLKHLVSVRNFLYANVGSDEVISFIIDLSLKS